MSIRYEAPSNSGFSIIEVLVATLLLVGLSGAALSALVRDSDFVVEAAARADEKSALSTSVEALRDLLLEASAASIDTSYRYYIPASSYDFESDRFPLLGTALRQCSSPFCGYHTLPDYSHVALRYQCGFQYRGRTAPPLVMGKTWPGSYTSCPLDGAPLHTFAYLDGLKMFTVRESSGKASKAFAGLASKRLTNLVIIFPVEGAGAAADLYRFDISIPDLMKGANLNFSADWTRFDSASPSMVDLFDFGKDGTTNGVPDGSVPVNNATSDAMVEYFGLAQGSDGLYAYVYKALDVPASGVSRHLSLLVRLADGKVSCSVTHQDAASTYWSLSNTFDVAPKVLARRVTEFAVSTARSNPHDDVSNPYGVSNESIVRITLGMLRAKKTRAEVVDDVTVISVRPRN